MNDNAKTDNGIRLNKYLSEAGICSRREADRLIEDIHGDESFHVTGNYSERKKGGRERTAGSSCR